MELRPEPEEKTHEILRVLCGSRAYGLHTPESDYDYHGVFVVPTQRFLEIGPKIKETSWVEGTDQDNVTWEIGHFLRLALTCNPTILETFVAPVDKTTRWGDTVRKLFPSVLAAPRIYEAYSNYSVSQRTKMLNGTLGAERQAKFAVQYLRVLHHGIELLRTGSYRPKLDVEHRDFLLLVKDGKVSRGQVIDMAETLQAVLLAAYEYTEVRVEPDIERVNDTLLKIRTAFWGGYWGG